MVSTRISGLGRALPERVLTNADLEKIVDTTDEWIVERSGIRERRILDPSLSTSDLAAQAALMACRQAEVAPAELDAIIVATVTPDTPWPATAVHVQQKIGAGTCPAFDISAACAGFLFGLGAAEGLLAAKRFKRVLVVGVEILSRIVDWTDRTTCVLFGDGAGAAVVGPCGAEEGQCIVDLELHSDGSQALHLELPAGGSREPTSHDTVEQRRHFVHMNGRQVFTLAVKNMASASRKLLERNGLTPEDVSVVFAHQANARILEGVSQRIGVPMDRFFNNIHRYGNTSSASIPVAMSEAVEQGRLKRGDWVLLTALGAGLSWGAVLVRW